MVVEAGAEVAPQSGRERLSRRLVRIVRRTWLAVLIPVVLGRLLDVAWLVDVGYGAWLVWAGSLVVYVAVNLVGAVAGFQEGFRGKG